MLPPIDRGLRRLIVTVSVVIAVGGFIIAPLTGSSYVAHQHHRHGDTSKALAGGGDPWSGRFVTVARDPFLAQSPSPERAALSPDLSDRSIVGTQVVQGQTIAHAVTPALFVRGIIFGETARAIVDTGAGSKIVSVGDYIAGMRVRSILRDRVVLANGLTLILRANAQ